MSGSVGDALDPDDEALKVERYSYLLPQASPSFIRRVASGTPPAEGEAGDTQTSADLPTLQAPDWPKLSVAQARDRAAGCLLGLAVGDAIGAAVEFKPRDGFPPLTGMIGGGPFNLAPGEWTDATTMALCLAESILACGTVDQRDFMTRLRGWAERGDNTVSGRCFDIGTTTREAILRFAADGNPSAGIADGAAAGNGSMVRLAPVAIFAAGNPEMAELLALKQSRATHAAQECLDGCKLFGSHLLDALEGAGKAGATRPRVMGLSPKLLFISAGEWRSKSRDQIHSGGYVVETLEAALWSIWQADNFRDAVLIAANLGDDAGSVAATAGQLAGALYGASAIPREWLARLAWCDRIEKTANDLFDRRLSV